jgi:hypothetical protein
MGGKEDATMARLFVRHQVADYATWRKGYDGSSALREAGGVRAAGVYVSVEDGNDVTVFHDFDSADAAAAFVGQEELKAVMKEIGVVGAPTVWITDEA